LAEFARTDFEFVWKTAVASGIAREAEDALSDHIYYAVVRSDHIGNGPLPAV
jgi:hypothetical protein